MSIVSREPGPALRDLVSALGGTWHGATAMCRCPAHADRTPSLSLRQGDHGLLVTCFAGCQRIDILRALRGFGVDRDWAPAAEHSPRPRSHAAIDRLWEAAGSAGQPLPRRYLTRRGFAALPPDLRYHPRCPLGPRPHTEFIPALLVAVREGRKLVALQRLFLDSAGRCTAKRMLGAPGRGAWCGRRATAALAIAEGFETAEAFSVLRHIPCWAALGASRLAQLVIPPSVATLLIAEDDDAAGCQAAAAAARAYARPGLTIRRMPPPTACKDWAHALEQEREGGPRS